MHHQFSAIGLMVFCCCVVVLSAATTTYQQDTANFPNPERGYFSTNTPPFPSSGTVEAWEQSVQGWTPALSATLMTQNRASGVSLHAMRYHLAMFRESAISQAFLDRLDADAVQARASGVKLNVRFVYGWLGVRPDATNFRIISHLKQLKSYFVKNADVIAFVEAGLVGTWGEWHSSQNGLLSGTWGHDLNALSREILDSLFAVVPPNRMITFRYPEQKAQYFHPAYTGDYLSDPTPMPGVTEAYSGSNVSRAGYYCDAFRSNSLSGTWHNGDMARVKQENLYTIMEGELDMGFGSTATLSKDHAATMAEFASYRWSAFNLSQNLATSSYAADWKSDGTFYEVAKRLGYRYRMINSDVPASVSAGATLNISIQMTNDGWARIYNSRNVEIVLRNQTGGSKHIITVDKGFGNRLWFPAPGETKTLIASGVLPASVTPGTYDLFLNLPDPYPSLHDRPEYSIRLANTGVWEGATGYNKLLQSVVIGGTTGVRPAVGNESRQGRVQSGSAYFSPNGRRLSMKDGISAVRVCGIGIRHTSTGGRATFQKVIMRL